MKTGLTIPVLPVLARQESPDGETRKDLLQLADGETVEVVLLRYRKRRSVCVSTQVGCACGCAFCATGQMGFVRDLSAEEILAQVEHARRETGNGLSNVVLMGMGEPFLNYDRTLAAVRHLTDRRGMGIPPRRVTVSTVGIVPGIERLGSDDGDLPVKLAISLHAATDEVRDRIMPINRRYPLADLFAAVERYIARTGRRVMFEWVFIAGVNDGPAQAKSLAERVAGWPVHVNLMRLNPTPGYAGRPASDEIIEAFAAVLDGAGIPHTMRQRRGSEIEAGCGQLRGAVRPNP